MSKSIKKNSRTKTFWTSPTMSNISQQSSCEAKWHCDAVDSAVDNPREIQVQVFRVAFDRAFWSIWPSFLSGVKYLRPPLTFFSLFSWRLWGQCFNLIEIVPAFTSGSESGVNSHRDYASFSTQCARLSVEFTRAYPIRYKVANMQNAYTAPCAGVSTVTQNANGSRLSNLNERRSGRRCKKTFIQRQTAATLTIHACYIYFGTMSMGSRHGTSTVWF